MEPTLLSSIARSPAFNGQVSPETVLPELRRSAGLQAWLRGSEPGALQEISSQTHLSAQQLTSLGKEVESQFEDFVAAGGRAAGLHWVGVDRAQLQRAIVGARAETSASIRGIQALNLGFYNLKVSYGYVQKTVREAEEAAGELLKSVPLNGADWVSVDELFIAGEPILIGVDLESEFIFCQRCSQGRSGKHWRQALAGPKARGLMPRGVVGDRGTGLLAGTAQTWPEAEQRSDLFHVIREITKATYYLERRAYNALEKAEKAEKRRMEPKAGDSRYSLGQKARRADERAERAMDAHDITFEVGKVVIELLEAVDLSNGQLRSSQEAQGGIIEAAKLLQTSGLPRRCRKLSKYLENVAKSACAYIDELKRAVQSVSEQGQERRAAELLAWLWRLDKELAKPSNAYRFYRLQTKRQEVIEALSALELAEGRLLDVLKATAAVLREPNRASSLVEAINSVLRPWLQAHKHVTQGALDLFAARWNFSRRNAGKLKGSCPFSKLTGVPVGDWLSLLGFPPSAGWN